MSCPTVIKVITPGPPGAEGPSLQITGPALAGRESGTGSLVAIPIGPGLAIVDGALTATGGGGGGGSGTVTSVGLSLPGIFTVTGSPVTGAGTLAAALAAQAAGLVFAGPASGGDAAPTFRQLGYGELSGRPTLGTGAGDVVQLDSAARLPAVDGSQLTNLPAPAGTNLAYDAPTREVRSSTGDDAVLPLVSTTSAGLAPATGTPSGKYLKDDGTWATVEAGASPAGSGTEIQYRNSSALGAIPNSSVDGATGAVTLARLILAANGAASTPPMPMTGTWFTGGTSTTTKPAFLLEPTGTTSTNWSTSGTGFGVNAPIGFAGNLLDLQLNGAVRGGLTSTGNIYGLSISCLLSGFALDGNAPTLRRKTTGEFYWGVQLGTNLGYLGTNVSVGILGAYSWGVDSEDLFVRRDAANTLAQRNGTNAQASRVYNTFTNATNFERGKIEWASNILRIGTEKGSAGGTARDMELQTDGVTRITVKADGAILFSGIPASNPNVAGQLWNDGGTLKISAG